MNKFILPENFRRDLDWYKLEVLASNHKYYQYCGEVNLYKSKWYDYRLLHPVESNIIFFEEYKWCYRHYYGKYVDHQESIVKRGVKEPSLYENKPAVINAAIKARIEADKIGIPYGLYCSFAMRILVENHMWQNIPLISQISMNYLVDEIRAEWEEFLSCDFLYPISDYFLAKNFCDDIVQKDFQDYLYKVGETNANLSYQFKSKGFYNGEL